MKDLILASVPGSTHVLVNAEPCACGCKYIFANYCASGSGITISCSKCPNKIYSEGRDPDALERAVAKWDGGGIFHG